MELFHLSNLLQMLNDRRMVGVELFGNFHVVVRGSASMVALRWLSSTSTTLLIFKGLISFAKLLQPPLHCMFISSSWAKCIVSAALQPTLNSRKLLEFAFCLTSFP